MKNTLLLACLVAFAAAPAKAVAKEEGRISLETGMDFNTGKYGGTQSTDILYVPVTGKYQGRLWTLKLTAPYLQITGPDNVMNVLNGVGTTGTATNKSVSRSGLGDMVVAATHNTYSSESSGLFVHLTGKVKFGTASRAKGLGTGENDYALQYELYQVTKSVTTFASLGYKVYGRPAGTGFSLNNGFFGSIGNSHKIDQDTNLGLMLSLGQKVSATGSPHAEVVFFTSHKLDNAWKARGYLLKGVTSGVPDWGIGVTIAYYP